MQGSLLAQPGQGLAAGVVDDRRPVFHRNAEIGNKFGQSLLNRIHPHEFGQGYLMLCLQRAAYLSGEPALVHVDLIEQCIRRYLHHLVVRQAVVSLTLNGGG